MKKSWIIILITAAILSAAIYQLTSNKAAIAAELAARKLAVLEVPVTVYSVDTGEVSRTIHVNGVIAAKEQVVVLSETSGQVQNVYREVGDKVQRGTHLALVDASVLNAQLEMAKVSLANNERDLARFENLLKSGATSQQTVDNLKLAVESARSNWVALQKQVANTIVKSPIRGTIANRHIEKGTVLGPGAATFTVADLSEMVMNLGLTEHEVAQIQVGMPLDVKIEALGRSFPAKVRTIGIAADLSGRYPVEVQLLEFPKGLLRPGMTSTASIQLPAVENQIVIPRKALVAGIKNPKVFVVQGNKVELRPITVSFASATDLVVSEGLAMDEKVVVTGQLNLLDGTLVKVME